MMRIRMVKAPPAPLMDGFDMRGLRVGQVYDVGNALARYLVVAGYAIVERAVDRADERKQDKPSE